MSLLRLSYRSTSIVLGELGYWDSLFVVNYNILGIKKPIKEDLMGGLFLWRC